MSAQHRWNVWTGSPVVLLAFACGPRADAPLPAPLHGDETRYGELSILQLDLPGNYVGSGESALVVGPDGTLALIDVGDAEHANNIRHVVRELNTTQLTVARGYAPREPLQVEWIILTHFHNDHVGGLRGLLKEGPDALTGLRGIVHRGHVDVGEGPVARTYGAVCDVLTGSARSFDIPLCTSGTAPSCSRFRRADTRRARACDGLLRGDLTTSADDDKLQPAFIPLGGGATLTFVGADTFMNTRAGAPVGLDLGHVTNDEENARSLVGIIRHGAFRYLFAGDLTGHGAADAEAHLVDTALPAFLDDRGVDVVHANHHARRTSSSARLVDALAPRDGRSRNVVAGINTGYPGSPHGLVLDAWMDQDRLASGHFWITVRAPSGDLHDGMVNGRGHVVIETAEDGNRYRVETSAGDQADYPCVKAVP